MRIEHWEIRLLRLPLAKPFYTADRAVEYCDTVYVSASGGGLTGWGEASPGNGPFLTAESARGAFAAARDDLLPLLSAGRSYETSESLAEAVKPVRGNRYAKGAFDMAWHDLSARIKGKPLWETLGGRRRPIEVGLAFDRLPEHENLYAELERLTAEKFHRVTIKMRPGWDVQAVSAARAYAPWPVQIQVDLEGALSLDQQSEMLYRVQDFMLLCVEQPFDPSDVVGHAVFQESFRTPISLDESIGSSLEASIALDLGSAKVLCLKPGRLGGLTETKLTHDAACEYEAPCYAGFELGTSLAYRHTIAAASLPGCSLPADYIRFGEVFAEEPGVPLLPELCPFPGKKESDPQREWQALQLWDEPGIGFEPDLDLIEKFTVEKAEL